MDKVLKTIIQTWLAVIILIVAGSAWAEETITWPYFNFPPYVILSGDEPTGISIEIQRYLHQGMPEYNHQRVKSPIVRSMLSVKHGETYCFTGLLKTPVREELLAFSKPCRLSPPLMIVSRKGVLDDLKEVGGIRLARLMNNDRFVLGVIKEMSYGTVIDDIIDGNRNENNVATIFASDTINMEISLILNERIDYAIIVPMQAKYETERMGVTDQIEFIPILENLNYFVGYIACTKNELGLEVIKKVNRILREKTPTEEYLNLFTPWINDSMEPEFRKKYKEMMLPNNAE